MDQRLLAQEHRDKHQSAVQKEQQQLALDGQQLDHYPPKLRTGIVTARELLIEHHTKAAESFDKACQHYLLGNNDLANTEYERGQFHDEMAQKFLKAIKRFHRKYENLP